MQFRVLGPVEAAAGAQQVLLGGGHQRTILAVLLAARGQRVSTDTLIRALWDESPPPTARRSLQSHVARLRGAFAALSSEGDGTVVVSVADGYRFRRGSHRLDVEAFEDLLERAGNHADGSPRQAIALLDRARDLVRGEPFGALASRPGIQAEATRIRRLCAAAEAARVDARLALGEHAQVIGALEATVARDPFDERAHGQLMLALYRSGRRAEALVHHAQLQDRLRDELGVDPAASLRDLHQRILRQDATLEMSAPSPRPTPHRPPARVLDADGGPRPGPALIGRDADVAEIHDLLSTARLLTLTGPGGVGKTRLAERVAHDVRHHARLDDVASCELAAVREPDAVGDALVTALGVQPTGERTPEDSLAAAIGDRELLLLVDNCEHVLPTAASLVSALLRRCPRLVVLATSRERLHLTEELVWQVAPLPVPEPDADADTVAGTPAGALFLARARAALPGFDLTAETAPEVAELCRRLDGMPLTIELAAARVRSMTPGDLVTRLDRRFSLLGGGPRHDAGRHRTLRAVVAWSYDLLEPEQAELFQRLSVFVGTFRLEAAERVCAGPPIAEDGVAGLLGDLVDQSMVSVDRRSGVVRYRLLDTLREFGSQRLAERGRTEALRDAHARYHVTLAEELGPLLRGPRERDAAREIDAAIDDLRAAHGWLLREDDVDGAVRLPAALGTYVFFRLHDEITTWARRAVARPRARDHQDYAAALATAALGATNRDECESAFEDALTALDRAAPGGSAARAALWAAATAAFYGGQLEHVPDTAACLARMAEEADDPFDRAFAEVLRVLAHSYRGEPSAAEAALPELAAAAAAAGNPTMHAFAHYCRGEVHLDGRPEQACEAFERAVDLAREVDNALVEGVSLVSLASVQGRSGQTQQALRRFRDVVAHWRRLGDHTHQLTTLRNLVELLVGVGQHEVAAELLGGVTGARTPTFGVEARRLTDAWQRIEDRLRPTVAAAALERGRRHSPTQLADLVLHHLDRLLER